MALPADLGQQLGRFGITLAHYGIGVLVADKRDGVPALSRTLVISTRGMELMRRWGLEHAVRAGAPDVIPRAWVTPDLACGDGTEMPLGYPVDEEAAGVSPCRPAWAPQDHHEPILLAHLRKMPSAAVRFGCELTALSQDQNGVRAVLADRETATTSQVGACYVIAADGAHSRVRRLLGIGMAGPDHLADYERAEFSAPLAPGQAIHDGKAPSLIIPEPCRSRSTCLTPAPGPPCNWNRAQRCWSDPTGERPGDGPATARGSGQAPRACPRARRPRACPGPQRFTPAERAAAGAWLPGPWEPAV